MLTSLYPALFLTLANVGPYLENLSIIPSTKLMQLFTSISQPSFLFANESNYMLLQYLLESFNSIIEQHFQSNPHFIYAMFRNQKRFTALREMTFDTGLAEAMRLKKAREERNRIAELELKTSDLELAKAADALKVKPGTAPPGAKSPESFPSADASAFSIGEENSTTRHVATATATATGPGLGPGLGAGNVRQSGSRSRKSSVDSMDFSPPARVMSEKARGKLPEGASLEQPRHASTGSLSSLSPAPSSAPASATINNDNNNNENSRVKSENATGEEEFIPTKEWFDAWFADMELQSIDAVFTQLSPHILKHLSSSSSSSSMSSTPNSTSIPSLFSSASTTTSNTNSSLLNSPNATNTSHNAMNSTNALTSLSPTISASSSDPRPILEFLSQSSLHSITPKTPNPRSFVWSEGAKVWFESLLWSWIYGSEAKLDLGGIGVWNGTQVKLFRVLYSPPTSALPTRFFH